MLCANVERLGEGKRRPYAKSILNANAQEQNGVLRFLTDTVYVKIRQAKLVGVPLEGQLPKKTRPGVYE